MCMPLTIFIPIPILRGFCISFSIYPYLDKNPFKNITIFMSDIFPITNKNSHTESNKEQWILLQVRCHFVEYNDLF